MIRFKTILPFILFLIWFGSQAAESKRVKYLLNKPQCTEENQKKIEYLMAKAAIVGPHGRKLPEDLGQVKAFCRDTLRMISEVERFFKDCYTKSVRNYASISIYTIKANVRRYCGKAGKRIFKQYIKLAPCANKYFQPDDHCIQQFTNKTKQLINLDDDRKKIPHACCYFTEAVQCFEDFLNTIPCLRRHASDFMDMFRAGFQSTTDILCGEYGQAAACDRLGPAPAPKVPNKTDYVTFPFVLIDLLDSLQELPDSPVVGA